MKAWHRVPRRQTTIPLHDLAAWYRAVMELGKETMRDYLLLILFTGLRRTEAARLRWSNVDLKAQTLLVPGEETKNHQPHLLLLSDYVLGLLQARPRRSEYVFPDPRPSWLPRRAQARHGAWLRGHPASSSPCTT